MFFYDLNAITLMAVVLLGLLALAGIIYLVVKRKGELNNKQHVLNVRGKYLPMWGEYYLYTDSAGVIKGDCTGDKCVFFDSEEEAKQMISSYINSKLCG